MKNATGGADLDGSAAGVEVSNIDGGYLCDDGVDAQPEAKEQPEAEDPEPDREF